MFPYFVHFIPNHHKWNSINLLCLYQSKTNFFWSVVNTMVTILIIHRHLSFRSTLFIFGLVLGGQIRMNFVNSIYSKSFLLKKIMNLLLRALRLFLTLIFCLYSSMNETHTHTEKNCSQNLRKTFICMIVSQTFLFLDLQIQSK